MLRIFLLFVVGSVVGGGLVRQESESNTHNVEQPEEVERLKRGQEGSSDVLADPALVLLSLPVQLKRSNGSEFGEHGPDDLEVNDMA